MRAAPPARSIGRAAIAVVALYALCLQVLLGALAPLPAAAAIPGASICQHDGTDGPAPAGAPCALPCCAAAQPLSLTVPALLAFIRLAWDAPDPAGRVPPAADARGPRAPPDRAASPRGPPQG